MEISWVDTTSHGVEPQPHWLVAEWPRLLEANIEVPPHPWKIWSHSLFISTSISLHNSNKLEKKT